MDLADRTYTELSGGERQLILIARALAQRPDVLIMDEPSASLDFGNQTRLLALIASLVKHRHLAVVMSSHFPNQAFSCASKVGLMKDGGMMALGHPDDVLTGDNLGAALRDRGGDPTNESTRRHPASGLRALLCLMPRPTQNGARVAV